MAKKTKTYLTNIDVELISILTDDVKPANRQSVIFKDDNHYSLTAQVTKSDAKKGLLYVTIMKADEADTYGEISTSTDIEKAAHNFLKKGKVLCADLNHNEKVEQDIAIVESYIEPETGDWKGVFDISKHEELLKKAAKDEITGVSIMGVAVKVEKNFKEKLVLSNLWNYTDAISQSIREIMSDEKVTDKKKAISTELDDFKTVILGSIEPVKKSDGGFFTNLIQKFKKNTGTEKEPGSDNNEDEEMTTKEMIKALEDEGYSVEKKQKKAEKNELDDVKKQSEEQAKTIEEQNKTIDELKKKIVKRESSEESGEPAELTYDELLADPEKFEKMEKEQPEKIRKMEDAWLSAM